MKLKNLRKTVLSVVCIILITLVAPNAYATNSEKHILNSMDAYDLTTGAKLDITEIIQLEIGHEYEIKTYFKNSSSTATLTNALFHADKHPFFAFDADSLQSYNGHFEIAGSSAEATEIRLKAPSTAIWIEGSYTLCYNNERVCLPEGRVIGLNGAPIFVDIEDPDDPAVKGGIIAPNTSGYVAFHITVKAAPEQAKATLEETTTNNTVAQDKNTQSHSKDHYSDLYLEDDGAADKLPSDHAYSEDSPTPNLISATISYTVEQRPSVNNLAIMILINVVISTIVYLLLHTIFKAYEKEHDQDRD